ERDLLPGPRSVCQAGRGPGFRPVGGVCPGGEACAPNSANDCGCLPPCGFDANQVCGGACPPDATCQVIGTPPECRCNPAKRCGVGAETGGVCSGSCAVAVQVCRTQKNATTGQLECTCVNN